MEKNKRNSMKQAEKGSGKIPVFLLCYVRNESTDNNSGCFFRFLHNAENTDRPAAFRQAGRLSDTDRSFSGQFRLSLQIFIPDFIPVPFWVLCSSDN